jgi:hypothetical protein
MEAQNPYLGDRRWVQPVEQCLGRTLKNFVVHDSHDHDVLRSLCRAEGLKFPACIIAELDAPSYHIPGLLPSHVQTMYHILSCTEESVAAAVINSLVDQVGTPACLLKTEEF